MLLILLCHYYMLRLNCKPDPMCNLIFLFRHPKIHRLSGHSVVLCGPDVCGIPFVCRSVVHFQKDFFKFVSV